MFDIDGIGVGSRAALRAAFKLAPVGTGWDEMERVVLVALLQTRPDGMTWSQITTEVDVRGSAVALWRELHPADLFDDGAEAPALIEAAKNIADWQTRQLGFLTFQDEDYPAQLREIHEMPPVLFHRGTLQPNELAMSVVGSRQASARGVDIARSVVAGLVDRGIAVIAGLAKGIDTAAHQATLAADGRTVAVIGTGINRSYPAENRELQDRIGTTGLVLSQFWPDAPPTKHSFPMRNAIMSGYGRATIVVEAGERSGARIQARQAVAHGRPVILTDLVVAATTWPADLIGRPGVHVASSTAEIMSIVEDIAAGPKEIDALFAAASRT
jgi:DNA processing protein